LGITELNNQLKEDILQNRNMLKPIIQTIRLCSRQQFVLSRHQDSGRISMKEPIQNYGNFRCLLRHRAQHGDNTLKKYLETCTMYWNTYPKLNYQHFWRTYSIRHN